MIHRPFCAAVAINLRDPNLALEPRAVPGAMGFFANAFGTVAATEASDCQLKE